MQAHTQMTNEYYEFSLEIPSPLSVPELSLCGLLSILVHERSIEVRVVYLHASLGSRGIIMQMVLAPLCSCQSVGLAYPA